MVLYLFRRLILAVAVMLVEISMLFCLVFVVPGAPASMALGPRATEMQKQALRVSMGLDQPVPIISLGNATGFDFELLDQADHGS